MKATLRELLDALGVERTLGAYDTAPWSTYDPEKGLTCNAEVRMGADNDEVEAEIQFIYDTPPEDGASVQQIFYTHAKLGNNGKWSPVLLKLKGELYTKVYDWEKKGCEFFLACTVMLARDKIPDIEELIERIFKAAENFGTGTGGGGGRKPTIRPEQLLDPTKKF